MKKVIFSPAIPVGKDSNGNTKMFEICWHVPEQRNWRCFGVLIVNYELISHIVLMFLWLILTGKFR